MQDGYYWARMHHGGEVEIVEIINSDSDVLVCAKRFNFDDMLRLDEFDIIEGVQPPDRVFIADRDRTVPPGWRLPSHLKDETTMQDRMLQFFEYAHLREELQPISKPFGELAKWIVDNLPENPERTAGLRKLLETKDCIIRARIYKETRGVAESP